MIYMYVSRVNEQPMFLKTMHAHTGYCDHCQEDSVKMLRDKKTGRLLPEQCFCLVCGQKYYMKIENIDDWEIVQWKQKQAKY